MKILENNFFKIIDYAKQMQMHNQTYFTEDTAFMLYGICKMIKPKNIIELGTGFGTVSFLLAHACKENNYGIVTTFDDGSQNLNFDNYKKFIDSKIDEFELTNYINFVNQKINIENLEPIDVDFVDFIFNDINASPLFNMYILRWLLPKIESQCYFFIDGGASNNNNLDILNSIFFKLNDCYSSKEDFGVFNNEEFLDLAYMFDFETSYVKKNSNNFMGQDSIYCIKILKKQ